MKNQSQSPILVSACLAGFPCRYNGKACPNPTVIKLTREGKAIPVCPEQLGSLPTPRPPVELVGNQAIGKDGADYTRSFKAGARKAVEIARTSHCQKAILKQGSPSCGVTKIYDGTFSGKLVKGQGIFARQLKNMGLKLQGK